MKSAQIVSKTAALHKPNIHFSNFNYGDHVKWNYSLDGLLDGESGRAVEGSRSNYAGT